MYAADFTKFQPHKTLPAAILDFVLRDLNFGIHSEQFRAAIAKGDSINIMEGIDYIIMNAEAKTRIKLSQDDRFMVHMMAQDMIVEELLDSVAKRTENDLVFA